MAPRDDVRRRPQEFDKELARFVAEYQSKYPKAVETLVDNKEALSAFFEFQLTLETPGTTNPIESHIRHGETAHLRYQPQD